MITKEEVLSEQKQWSDGLLNIGKLYSESADYKQAQQTIYRNYMVFIWERYFLNLP